MSAKDGIPIPASGVLRERRQVIPIIIRLLKWQVIRWVGLGWKTPTQALMIGWLGKPNKLDWVSGKSLGWIFILLFVPFSSPFWNFRDEGTYCLEIRWMHVSKRITGAILSEFIRPTDPCLKAYKSKVSLFCRSIYFIQNNDQEFGRNKSFIKFFILVVRKWAAAKVVSAPKHVRKARLRRWTDVSL